MEFQKVFININVELAKMQELINSLKKHNLKLEEKNKELSETNIYKQKIDLIENLISVAKQYPIAANEFRVSLQEILEE